MKITAVSFAFDTIVHICAFLGDHNTNRMELQRKTATNAMLLFSINYEFSRGFMMLVQKQGNFFSSIITKNFILPTMLKIMEWVTVTRLLPFTKVYHPGWNQIFKSILPSTLISTMHNVKRWTSRRLTTKSLPIFLFIKIKSPPTVSTIYGSFHDCILHLNLSISFPGFILQHQKKKITKIP